MAGATVVPGAIVVQVLNEDNYEDWSVQVKTYLMAEDLLEVVEATSESPPKPEDAEFKAWRKNNAKALHAIQISCEPETFSLIRYKSTAKSAWDTLAAEFKSPNSSGKSTSFHTSTIVEKQAVEGSKIQAEEDSEIGTEEDSEIGTQEDFKTEEQRTAVHDVHLNNANYDFREYQPFFHAVRCGDWNYAREFITRHPNAITARLPDSGQTALHIATESGQVHIVQKLVQLMSVEDLEIKGAVGKTALEIASMIGITKMGECMVTKNKNLLSIADIFNSIPVVTASSFNNWDMVRYLYSVTPLEDLMPENGFNGAVLFRHSLYSKTFDIAWDLLRRCPPLIISQDHNGEYPILALSQVSFGFPSRTPLKFWQRWIYKCIPIEPAGGVNDIHGNVQILENKQVPRFLQGLVSNLLELLGIKQIYKMKVTHVQFQKFLDLVCEEIKYATWNEIHEKGFSSAIFNAVKEGIYEIIISAFKANPDLIPHTNDERRNAFQYAIECRQEKVYNLIYGLCNKNMISSFSDEKFNTSLHIAGMLSPSAQLNRIPGAALQMQRELQWFKEVETILPPMYVDFTNSDRITPRDVFTESHKELVKEGEKWMKEMASSCTVVGALIITIMFAAAFTIPGGNDDDGFPIFLHKNLLSIFIASDAIALFSSTTSVLMFLGILTSRYAENDFLKSLPTKMIIGLSTLFISIASMTVAFCSALLIMFHGKTWIVTPTIFLASVPVTLFVWLQFPLLVEIFISTYGGGIFNKKVKPWVYIPDAK